MIKKTTIKTENDGKLEITLVDNRPLIKELNKAAEKAKLSKQITDEEDAEQTIKVLLCGFDRYISRDRLHPDQINNITQRELYKHKHYQKVLRLPDEDYENIDTETLEMIVKHHPEVNAYVREMKRKLKIRTVLIEAYTVSYGQSMRRLVDVS